MVNETAGRKAALICGSVAYDTIMVFPDRFKAHILPDKLHMLNVSFLVPEMRREFGGGGGGDGDRRRRFRAVPPADGVERHQRRFHQGSRWHLYRPGFHYH